MQGSRSYLRYGIEQKPRAAERPCAENFWSMQERKLILQPTVTPAVAHWWTFILGVLMFQIRFRFHAVTRNICITQIIPRIRVYWANSAAWKSADTRKWL